MKRREHEEALRKLRASADTLELLRRVLDWNKNSYPFSIDDREAVIVSFILIEQALRFHLSIKLELTGDERENKIFDFDGGKPVLLGSAENRALLAYTLDLISESCLKDIRDISLIRNTFAHASIPLSCNHPSIQELAQLRCLNGLDCQFRLFEGENVYINFATPRAKITAFALLFYLNSGQSGEQKGFQIFSSLFQPYGPFPRKKGLKDLPTITIPNP